jgi:hypothetical protein
VRNACIIWSSGYGRRREATDAIDTEACDILEDAMVKWGFKKEWIDNSIQDLGDMLFV